MRAIAYKAGGAAETQPVPFEQRVFRSHLCLVKRNDPVLKPHTAYFATIQSGMVSARPVARLTIV